MSTASAAPVYYEESWAILSTIGVVNVFYGTTVVGITSLSPISIVPLVVAIATAIANGLCYYAFYAGYNTTATVIAAGFADFFWLIQEAGLSFYSYIILNRVLSHRSRIVFKALFWSMIAIIAALRFAILGSRARNILNGNQALQKMVSRLHIGYFVAIAVVELISAFFLLQKFASARRTSKEAASTSGLFSYLMRSTEVRLASLALIGITRAVTYSFQESAQSATNIASQVDRFVYTMECMFPVMMFIDILASRLVVINHIHSSNENSRPNAYGGSRTISKPNRSTSQNAQDISLYSMNHIETRVEAKEAGHKKGKMTDSRERIIEIGVASTGSEHSSGEYEGVKGGGINRTVDFDFTESKAV